MKKLKLNIDDLKVQSFKTSLQETFDKGTVKGNALTLPSNEASDCPTCGETCYSCVHTNCIEFNTCDGGDTCGHVTCDGYGSCDSCAASCECYTWPNPQICTD